MESIGAFLPLILIFGVFYILLIRPQQKKAKQHREMINNLSRGDKIITSGGIICSIKKVNDNRELQVEISDGVEIKIAPGMVADIYTQPEKAKTIPTSKDTKGKTNLTSKDTNEKKGGLLSGFFGSKK